jgi:hypothetical protein
MQNELQLQVSRLLEEAEQSAQRGEREKAYQTSLEATGIAPDEPLAWYLRSRNAASLEEQLLCLSRALTLEPKHAETRDELRKAIRELLKKEPFLAYVYETQDIYQVRSGRDLLINIPKNRTYEIPYLKRNSGPVTSAYRWLNFTLLGLLLGGVGAILLSPIVVLQVLRLQAMPQLRRDRARLWIVFVFAILIWLLSIPISWLLLIRLFPS